MNLKKNNLLIKTTTKLMCGGSDGSLETKWVLTGQTYFSKSVRCGSFQLQHVVSFVCLLQREGGREGGGGGQSEILPKRKYPQANAAEKKDCHKN